MKRGSLLLAALLGLVLVTGLAVAASSRHAHDGPVYSVAAVRARLAHQPGAWAGRTVVVRARTEPCLWWGALPGLLHCASAPLVLVGMPAEAPAAPLPLVPPAPHPLLAFLRGLPMLGGLLPRPWAVPLLVPARFRVRLLALPADACAGRLPCYEAVPLDAAL